MANDNPIIPVNPNLVEHGKRTQFGAPGNLDPREAAARSKPYGIRAELRRLVNEEVDTENPEELKPRGKMTRARLIALKQLQKAMEGSDTAFTNVVENTEGKLANVNLNADLDTEGTLNDPEYIAAKQAILREVVQTVEHSAPAGDNKPVAG